MNIHLVNPFFQVITLVCLLFCVKKVKYSLYSTTHCCTDTLTTTRNTSQWFWKRCRHISTMLLLGCWGYPDSHTRAFLSTPVQCRADVSHLSCSTRRSKTKTMFFWPTDHIQVQIILSTVLLCHISSRRMTTIFYKTQIYVTECGGVDHKSKIWVTFLTPTAVQSAT